MTGYILWSLLLYFIYVMTSAGMCLLAVPGGAGAILKAALGSRDKMPDAGIMAERAGRAQRNMEESLFFFLPLALLALFLGKADGLAATGALVYVIARAVYLPVYVFGIFAARTAVWSAGLIGIVMMLVRLHS